VPPVAPPGWATKTIPEDGGMVHERVSPHHPTIKVGGGNGWELMPTDVSIGVTDLLIDGRWIRTEPTVQIEGGSYSLEGARQLQAVLTTFVAAVEDEDAIRPL
jgi:hypothetical protein